MQGKGDDMFKIIGRGFHLVFDNGYTISVQFGFGNYCENRNRRPISSESPWHLNSTDAEVAVWNKDTEWETKRAFKGIRTLVEEYSIGQVSPDVLARVIHRVSHWKALRDRREEIGKVR